MKRERERERERGRGHLYDERGCQGLQHQRRCACVSLPGRQFLPLGALHPCVATHPQLLPILSEDARCQCTGQTRRTPCNTFLADGVIMITLAARACDNISTIASAMHGPAYAMCRQLVMATHRPHRAVLAAITPGGRYALFPHRSTAPLHRSCHC